MIFHRTHHRTAAAFLAAVVFFFATWASAQVTTPGFLNQPRAEAPGTLLSHPVTNGSEPIGRTTSVNYLNGWIIIGGESPGSRPGSDLQMRVYDISDPANPVRRLPADFGLGYSSWIFGNYGWNAHGTAQFGSLLLPDPIRVATFGGLVERGGTNGIPTLAQLPVWYNRSSQAGPWNATLLWYNTGDADIEIAKVVLNGSGFATRRILATFDHVGAFGGGDWHPMFFGDLLIMARSGAAGNDGVVVYRLAYHNMEDASTANDAVTPQFLGSLAGGFQGYWPNLFSDGTGLYVIGSTSDILIAADISQAANPAGSGAVTLAASLTVPNFSNASYPSYQDNFGFIHNRKVDMTRFLAGDANPVVLTLNELNPPRPPGAPALPGGAIVGVNTSQMSLALGNLWLTGGYPIPSTNQGLGVWVHQQAPDTTPPPKVTARAMRPLWRDLILRVWGADPLQCPCCKATMKVVDTFFRSGEIEFFLRLQGLWEGIIDIPPPPDPPFDIETFEPIEPPWQAIREWIPDDDGEPSFDLFDQRPDSGKPVEIPREDGSILVLDSD